MAQQAASEVPADGKIERKLQGVILWEHLY